MQVVILCGGSGTRLREQTEFIPKPLISIGPVPMVVHIMRWYAKYGHTDFVLALGYKQEAFKEYFSHYDLINHDITVNIGSYAGMPQNETSDRWRVILSDTGANTLKGARLKRVEKYIEGDTFLCTYGDGIGDIDIPALVAYHKSHGKLVTVTGVHPIPKFGEIHHNNGCALSFSEKPQHDDCLVNGGFFVMNRGVLEYLHEDEWCDLEVGPLEMIARKGELMVYKHTGYWGCMDTIKDMDDLRQLWDSGKAKWRV